MISSKDRSYYIGASDTSFVVGNWNTKTFEKWYGTKLGIYSMDYVSLEMRTGTAYEHRILESLNIKGLEMDKQIIKGRLRVNLDGNTHDTIYEVKTHKNVYKPPKEHREQVYVEMYGSDIRTAKIEAYALTEADYKNFYNDIETDRLTEFDIEYDEKFINGVYLPKFNYLCECLDKGVWPKWNLQE
jgi:hypothetical protein